MSKEYTDDYVRTPAASGSSGSSDVNESSEATEAPEANHHREEEASHPHSVQEDGDYEGEGEESYEEEEEEEGNEEGGNEPQSEDAGKEEEIKEEAPKNDKERLLAEGKKELKETKESVTKAKDALKDLLSGKANVVDAAFAIKGAVDALQGLSGKLSAAAMMPVMKALSAFKGKAILPAGKQMDPVLGIDVHMVTIPPSPAPVPLPHPYIGILFNPADFVSCVVNSLKPMAMAAVPEPAEDAKPGLATSLAKNKDAIAGLAMGALGLSASVTFGSFIPRAVTGTPTKNVPHIPMGAGFHPAFVASVAKNHGKAFLGSLFVAADGDPMVGSFHLHYDCWDIGVVDLFKGLRKAKKPKSGEPLAQLYVPSGTVLPIPWGKPVLVNSIPTPINPMALLDKIFKAGLGKLKAAGRKGVQKGLDQLTGKVGCGPLTKVSKLIGTGQSHPVDVAEGHFYTDNIDFSLPGPIPISWERTWYSYSNYRGPLGYGWHHSYDMALAIDDETMTAVLRMSDGRVTTFELPSTPTGTFNRSEKLTLHSHDDGYYYVTDNKGLIYRFTQQQYQNPYNKTTTHLLQSIANRNGFAIRFSYNDEGLLIRLIDSAGRRLAVNNDENGRITTIHAPHPEYRDQTFAIAKYSYTIEGDMSHHYDALNQAMKFEYENHLMVKEIWRNGLNWHFRYDKESGIDAKCIEVWGDGDLLHYKFDYSNPEYTVVANSLGFIKTFYHRSGVVLKYKDPNGEIWEYHYNQHNEIERETDALGNEVCYTYDDWGNMVTRTLPDRAFSQTNYYHFEYSWLPTKAIEANGAQWEYRYDTSGNLVESINPMSVITRYEFKDGLFHSMTDGAGSVTRLSYDSQYNVQSVVNANGNSVSYEYDLLGNCVRVTNENGQRQYFVYNLKGSITQITDFDGSRIDFQYDALDNIIHYKGPNKEVYFAYNGMWKMTSRTEGGSTLRLLYDTEEQLCGIINEQSLRYSFERDGCGNVVKETSFDGISRTYDRNAGGLITRVNRPGAKYTLYQYDETSRITEIKYHDGTVRNFMYSNGVLSSAKNSDANVLFDYDLMNNRIKEITNDICINSNYDKLSRRIGILSSLGADIGFEYNQLDDIVGIRADDWEAQIKYDRLGLEISRQLTGGVLNEFTREPGGHLKTHLVRNVRSPGKESLRRQYKWDMNDQLREINDDTTGLTKYEHDKWGNLSKVTFSDHSEQLRNIDTVGNIYQTKNKKDSLYDEGCRLLRNSKARFKYDDEGFLIEKQLLNGDTWKYEWNGAGWLVRVVRPDNTDVHFKYDALGRRIQKRYKKTVTNWIWDEDKPLHEWKEFDAKESSPEQLITWVFEEDSFTPSAKIKADKRYSIISDHVGTPIQAYNENGELIWKREIDTYGNIRILKGDAGFCNYLYPGQSLDAETGLAYNRFRYYSADEGVYISQDPIGLNSGQPNLYAYVKDPNIWVDLFGLVGGGSYRQARKTNKGGEVHHMPADSVNASTGSAGHGSAPAIHMTTSDHARTGSHGSQGAKGAKYRAKQEAHIKNGRYDLAMAMDIRNVSRLFPGKYKDSMLLAIKYARDRKPPLITADQAKNLRKQCK